MATTASPSDVKSFRLVCPKCKKQNDYDFTVDDLANLRSHGRRCLSCNNEFAMRIVNIRAKRSQGDKKNNRRSFSIRVKSLTNDDEDLIEFVTKGYGDFELRSKDTAVFSYFNNKLRIVQNLTVGQFMEVSDPSCYVATYLYGADSQEVAILRRFRDDVLLDSPLAGLVSIYYRLSPVAIRYMGSSRIFRAVVLVTIKPILWGAAALTYHHNSPTR